MFALITPLSSCLPKVRASVQEAPDTRGCFLHPLCLDKLVHYGQYLPRWNRVARHTRGDEEALSLLFLLAVLQGEKLLRVLN